MAKNFFEARCAGQAVRTRAATAAVAAAAIFGLAALASAPANATFVDMNFSCDVSGPVGNFSCDPIDPKATDSQQTIDGALGIWESWYTPGWTDVTIDISGIYEGDTQPGGYVDYYLGIDKDVVNHSNQIFTGFDIEIWGDPMPWLMSDKAPLDTTGLWEMASMTDYGVWFDGQQGYDEKSVFWFGVSVPLHVGEDNSVYGSIVLHQYAKTVPEPGTLAIFAFGLIGLGWMVRRRRSLAMADL